MCMAQISVTISDETDKLLTEMSEATGLTKSSLAAEILRRGLYEEASNQSVVAEFRRNRRSASSSTQGKGGKE